MKFFTNELWCKINSEDENERLKAEEQWEINDKAYSKEFKVIKEKLPPKFLLEYLQNYGFHDFSVSKIEIVRLEEDSSLNLTIVNGLTNCIINYGGVKKVSLSWDLMTDMLASCDWGYDEFSIVDDTTMSHEILFSTGSNLLVYFQKIKLINI
ncbi:hypothetical protein [Alkaliphilus crotonatoxidans]